MKTQGNFIQPLASSTRLTNQIMRCRAKVDIHNKPITRLVDTGSPISIIPGEIAEQILNPNWMNGRRRNRIYSRTSINRSTANRCEIKQLESPKGTTIEYNPGSKQDATNVGCSHQKTHLSSGERKTPKIRSETNFKHNHRSKRTNESRIQEPI